MEQKLLAYDLSKEKIAAIMIYYLSRLGAWIIYRFDKRKRFQVGKGKKQKLLHTMPMAYADDSRQIRPPKMNSCYIAWNERQVAYASMSTQTKQNTGAWIKEATSLH